MKIFSLLFLLFSCCHSFAQDADPSKKDTLIWSDGTVYSGTVVKQEKGMVKFKTEDGEVHTVPAASIAQLKLANPLPDTKTQHADKKPAKAKEVREIPWDEAPIHWSDPSIPHQVVVNHKVGVGLSICGGTMVAAGIGMIAGGIYQNGSTTYTTNYNTTTTNTISVGVLGGIGIGVFIVGLPMVIVGIIKVTRTNKKARESMRGTIHMN